VTASCVVSSMLLRRTVAVALAAEAALLLVLAWFFLGIEGDVLIVHPTREEGSVLVIAALLGYAALLVPAIVYAWHGALPASPLNRLLVLTASLVVTLTQLALPFAIKDGLNDALVLWGFSVALGLAYMLNCDVLRPAPAKDA